jgi:hypothetical protein
VPLTKCSTTLRLKDKFDYGYAELDQSAGWLEVMVKYIVGYNADALPHFQSVLPLNYPASTFAT